MKDGISYTTLEDSEAIKGGRDIVLYQAAAGKREILVPASKLVPAGEIAPLAIENYDWSNDGKLLIVFTNSKRVWRQNTRGDFWVLNLASGSLKKLGAEFEPSTLQFAKFAPAGRRAAYVRKNDIYAEDLDSRQGRPPHLGRLGDHDQRDRSTGSMKEEFSLRDGFRWSPDGQSIAFWQLDSSGVRNIF